jgi:hypothetical protein
VCALDRPQRFQVELTAGFFRRLPSIGTQKASITASNRCDGLTGLARKWSMYSPPGLSMTSPEL